MPPDANAALAQAMRAWQQVETDSISQATAIGRGSPCGFVRLVMEIIRRVSAQHRRVQQFILDCLDRGEPPVTAADIQAIRGALAEHTAAEQRTVDLAMQASEALADETSPALEFLLAYLELDEAKHDRLLDGLQQLVRRLPA
jgi:hypothetical protein